MYSYNVELENEFKGYKYYTLNFSTKLEKDKWYKCTNDVVGTFRFKIIKQVKDNDLTLDDLDWIRVCIEGWDDPDTNKIARKISSNVRKGKLITLSKEEIKFVLCRIIGDSSRKQFEKENSKRDVELVDKILKKYKWNQEDWFGE